MGCIANITTRAGFSFPLCSRSRPAVAPRTALIVRRARTTIPAFARISCSIARPSWRAPRRRRRQAPPALHGRRLAQPEGSRPRESLRAGAGGEGPRLGDLRHLGDAHRRAGAGAQGGGARLLQPQPRHQPRALRSRSSPPAATRTGSKRSPTCARQGSRSAVAASSAWESREPTARVC